MRIFLHLCAIAGLALVAAPLAAQTESGQPPAEDKTATSVPPAPPPPHKPESPPPFPSFPYVEPRHHRASTTHYSGNASHAKNSKRTPSNVSKRHKQREPGRKLTKQEKKDQRYCASLSQRQLRKNTKCRKLLDKQRETSITRPLTKQEKKDERYCGSLSLRQVMQNSKCRKVAERQLETTKHHENSKRKGKSQHKTEQHKRSHSDSHKHVTKHHR